MAVFKEDKEWKSLQKVLKESKPEIIVVLGPQNSGKSILCNYLTNMLQGQGEQELYMMDIDCGQPNHCLPGTLSLSSVKNDQLSVNPSFSVLKQYFLDSANPAFDFDRYFTTTMTLIEDYKSILQTTPKCRLVVNTCGWVEGLGAEFLHGFVDQLRSTL